MRTRFLPAWVSLLGLLAAAFFLVSALGVTTDADPVMLFGLLGFVAWSIWILGVSAHMWRTP